MNIKYIHIISGERNCKNVHNENQVLGQVLRFGGKIR